MRPQFIMPMPAFWDQDNGPPPESRSAGKDIIVPPRVEKAMEFLNLLSQKTMTRAVSCEMHTTEIPGQKLTDEEAVAHATACNLISKYFAGQLPPDQWELVKLKSLRSRRKKAEPPAYKLLTCPACAGRDRACQLCDGRGRLTVVSGPVQNLEEVADEPSE